MNYGAHIYLWTDRWSDDSLDLLDRARNLGLGCLEIAVGEDVAFAPQRTRQRAQALQMDLILSPGGAWPMECDISAEDPAHRQSGMDFHRRYIDLAADVGAIAYTGAIYGHPGRVLRRRPPAEELPRTAENLHHLAEHAARRGLKLVLEPMSHFRTHLVNTPAQAMRLIDLADHPNLFVLLDTYHLVTEMRDYAEAVRTCRRRLWGVHACESDRGVPGGGLVPWQQLWDALNEVPAAYPVLFESYNSSLNDFAFARGLFHDVCPDGDAFVRQGLAFLRSLSREKSAHRLP